MSAKTAYHSDTRRVGLHHRPIRYLVVGREGSLALGSLLSRLLRLRGSAVDEMINFDHRRSLTLYEIEIQGNTSAERPAGVDLLICLNDASLDYESQVRKSGTLILNGNSVTRRPKLDDIDVVAVPAFNLIQDISQGLTEETRSRLDPSISSLIGSIEAIEGEYPDADTLRRVFEKLQIETVPFLTAVYRGYDWLEEMRMRGKTACGGMLN